jgi:oligo-1,6-glucosidase
MRREVLDKYDLLTVGEAGGTTDSAIRYANEDGSELDMIFSFEHNDGLNDGTELGKWSDHGAPLKDVRRPFNRWQTALQGKAWNTVYLGNHDQPRQVSRYGNDSELFRARSAKMLATMIHMMRGTPYVYQGEELGMTNIYFTDVNQYEDVEVHNAWHQWVESGLVDAQDMLRYFARIARDHARTPMQWNTEKNAGFTTGTPWLPVNKNYLLITAEDQVNDPDSVPLLPETDRAAPYLRRDRVREVHPVAGGRRESLCLCAGAGRQTPDGDAELDGPYGALYTGGGNRRGRTDL